MVMQTEGLLIEQNRTACYNLIEQFSECISKHVSVMQKQRYVETHEFVVLYFYVQNRYLIKCLNQTFSPLFHLSSIRIQEDACILPKISLLLNREDFFISIDFDFLFDSDVMDQFNYTFLCSTVFYFSHHLFQ